MSHHVNNSGWYHSESQGTFSEQSHHECKLPQHEKTHVCTLYLASKVCCSLVFFWQRSDWERKVILPGKFCASSKTTACNIPVCHLPLNCAGAVDSGGRNWLQFKRHCYRRRITEEKDKKTRNCLQCSFATIPQTVQFSREGGIPYELQVISYTPYTTLLKSTVQNQDSEFRIHVAHPSFSSRAFSAKCSGWNCRGFVRALGKQHYITVSSANTPQRTIIHTSIRCV